MRVCFPNTFVVYIYLHAVRRQYLVRLFAALNPCLPSRFPISFRVISDCKRSTHCARHKYEIRIPLGINPVGSLHFPMCSVAAMTSTNIGVHTLTQSMQSSETIAMPGAENQFRKNLLPLAFGMQFTNEIFVAFSRT